MSTRLYMLPEFQYLIDLVLDMQEKWFFSQCPEAKEAYRKFKADVKVYKYASDEHIENYVDEKTGKMVRMERVDYLMVDLVRQRYKLDKVIHLAHKAKLREREREAKAKEFEKQRKIWTKGLEKGEITQEMFDKMERRGFRKYTDAELFKIGGY